MALREIIMLQPCHFMIISNRACESVKSGLLSLKTLLSLGQGRVTAPWELECIISNHFASGRVATAQFHRYSASQLYWEFLDENSSQVPIFLIY